MWLCVSVYRNWIIAIRFDCRMTDECSNSFFFCFNSKTLAVLIAHTLWTSPFTIKCTNALDRNVSVRRHLSAPNHGTFLAIANDIYLWCANGDVMHRDMWALVAAAIKIISLDICYLTLCTARTGCSRLWFEHFLLFCRNFGQTRRRWLLERTLRQLDND